MPLSKKKKRIFPKIILKIGGRLQPNFFKSDLIIDSVRPLLAIKVQSHPLLPLTRNISFTSDAKSEAMT